MEEKIITAEEYQKAIAPKEVTLPSGLKVTIRKVHARELVSMPEAIIIREPSDVARTEEQRDERAEVLWDKMTDEQKAKTAALARKIMVMAVVSPAITLERVPGAIFLDDMPDDDYGALMNAVNENQSGGASLRPFREVGAPGNPGPGGDAVRSETVGAPQG